MNSRNLDYIFECNPRKFYQRVDDKITTKSLAAAVNIPCPKTFGIITEQSQIKHFHQTLSLPARFVIKPAKGSGGGGILVIQDNDGTRYTKTSGQILDISDIKYHMSNILSGLYSLGGQPDRVLIEAKINSIRQFDTITYQGVPDIRIIVFHGVPVMAMLRLPTKASDGKANLHCGGLGVGVCMKTAQLTHAIQYNRLVTEHPDTQAKLSAIKVPHWKKILTMAASMGSSMGLNYIGVDIVIDEQGPMLLEVNARPGLAIQIANQAGLLPRLNLIKEHKAELDSVADKVAFCRKHFG